MVDFVRLWEFLEKIENLRCNTMTFPTLSPNIELQKPPMLINETKTINHVAGNTYRISSNNAYSSYFKININGGSMGYGDTNQEAASYVLLRPYLRMPRIRQVDIEGNKVLFVKEINGNSVHDLLEQGQTDLSLYTLDLFFSELLGMWKSTEKRLAESVLSNNPFQMSLAMIEKISNSDLEEVNHINGAYYPSIRETLLNVSKDLRDLEETMVLGHGDENLMNIFYNDNNYSILDPRMSGYYPPSNALNIILGHPLLFVFDYEQCKPTAKYVDCFNHWNDFISDKINWIEEIYPTTKLRALLFVNLARTYIGGVNPKNLKKTFKNRIAHMAFAQQIYTHGRISN